MTRLTEKELRDVLRTHEIVSDTGNVDMRKSEAHRAMDVNPRPNKLGNVLTMVDGIRFDSKAEARRYSQLKVMEQAGLITGLKLQPEYKLLDSFTDSFGRKHRAAVYRGDFLYIQDGQIICEDVKGHPTPVFSLKWKLAILAYPTVKFEVVK